MISNRSLLFKLSSASLLFFLAWPGCSSSNDGNNQNTGGGLPDAGTDSGATGGTNKVDAGTGGSSTGTDAGVPDGGSGSDASTPTDSSTGGDVADTGTPDAGNADTGTPDTGNADTGTPDANPPDAAPDGPPTGTAKLSFVAKYGQKVQFSAGWNMSIPGYEGDATLVFMLCNTADPTCREPVLLRAASSTEKEDKAIQFSWGPQVTLSDLPAGSYKFMLFADSKASRDRGYGWDQPFTTKEKDWGGKVSETDLMLNDPADPSASGHNPEPKAMDVTLVNGQTAALGDLLLSHYHQRDISPDPQKENGIVAVATDNGVRVVNLKQMNVQTAYTTGATKYYDYVMQDAQGEAVSGSVCGMVRGPDKTVFVLYRGGTGAGFAIQFNPVTGVQLSTHPVIFPGTSEDGPCRGYYHENGGQKYLWVTNAIGPSKADEGVWYANVGNLATADITAGRATQTDDLVFKAGIDQIAALGDTVYFASNAPQAPCNGASCAFKASFDATGKPTFKKTGADYDALVGPALNGAVTTAGGDVTCVTEAGYAGMAIAKFHDGKDLLFLGQCLEITAFDLATGTKLDYNGAAPGKPGLDATLFGQGFISFSPSPDGKILWAVSNDKSVVHFNLQKGISGNRQTYNRWMLLPIDLGSGDMPGIHPDYNKNNIDGFEGKPSIGIYTTPAIDPGVDVDFAYLKQYIIRWAPDLAGGTPTAIPVGPTIAAANNTVWLRGSQIAGSGLANQGNLAVYALPDAKVVLWPRGARPFYEVWTGGTDTKWGFDLTPENDNSVGTHGLLYFDTP